MHAWAAPALPSADSSHHAPLRAQIVNGLMMKLDAKGPTEPITVHYNDYGDGGKVGKPTSIEVDMVIGADGANSRVAKDIDAGEYDYAIAFQV